MLNLKLKSCAFLAYLNFGRTIAPVHENIKNFIEFHNDNIIDISLTANFQSILDFTAQKHIALEDLSIEKHRLPFINWFTSLPNS